MTPEIAKNWAAEEDLIDVWIYSFEKWGIVQADEYIDQLDKGFKFLAENPQAGINREDIRTGYLSFPIKKHMVFYKIETKTLRIIRVLAREMEYHTHLDDTPSS